MCGIAGFIGHSKKPIASFELITHIFDQLEIRGTDASGYYGTQIDKPNPVYAKLPIKASEFIKRDLWLSLKKHKLDMLIIHARATSKGGGHPDINENNHPFVSADMRIGLAHNGTLEEAHFLKDRYEILSNTDSEYLLRIYEAGLVKEHDPIEGVPNDVANRVTGIKDIWSYVSQGAMAVTIAEQLSDDVRGLTLFRNEKRPLWLADMRMTLGQIFFFSSPDIWYRAIASDSKIKKMCWGSQKLIELPPFQIWHMRIDKEDPIVTEENLFKLGVNITNSGKEFQKDEYYKVSGRPVQKPIDNPVTNVIYPLIEEEPECFDPCEEFDDDLPPPEIAVCTERHDHDAQIAIINGIMADIKCTTHNLLMEGSMSESKYTELMESLEQSRCDLEGTLRILKG